ncbi:MAG: hypothetical protein PF518_12000 [Spirochaetaceae bacterium]|jgi:hypothetical protein|nr:hypothetical protein [Spirochaetaceae bacterium]
MIDMIFAGIGTAASAIQTLRNLAKSTKGLERSFLLEIQQNIRLLEEFYRKDLDADKTIGELETDNFLKIIESNFNFNKLQRKKVSEKTIGGIKSLDRYVNWDTEKLVTNIFQKIIHLQKLTRIGYNSSKFNLRQRLKNLLILKIMLSKHIKS